MKKTILTAAIVAGICLSPGIQAQTMYGITDANSIFTMANVSTPSVIGGPYTVSGVASGQTLVGLDVQPGTGNLYALGYDSLTTTAQLYQVTYSGGTYTATTVGSATTAINLGLTNNAAFDFVSTNPDQIRVVARNGNNYVLSAATGSVTVTGSSALSFAVGDIYAGLTNSVAATAYTNSFLGADATQEIGYDAVNNVLVKFDAGTFANAFNNTSYTIHSIGIGTGVTIAALTSVGMDTWYDTILHDNTVYVSARTLLGGTHLYKYDLSGSLGTLTDVGAIGTGALNVRDVAFATTAASTASVTGNLITALSLNLRNLITFDSKVPGALRTVKKLNGMNAGETMIALDYSMSGMLYGLGYNSTGQTYTLYTIDTVTGNVTEINTTPHNLALGIDDGSGNRISAAFRFIPTLDNAIRVSGNNGMINATIDATTGAVISTDTVITYVTGDMSFGAPANLVSMAFTGYRGDVMTQAYGFDANTGEMIEFDATNGTGGMGDGSSGFISSDISLNTVLTLLGHTGTFNNAYMDIVYNPSVSTNVGFIAANYIGDSSDQGNYSIFYDMSDMLVGSHKGTSSAPVSVGNVGYGTPVKDAVISRPSTSGTTGFAVIQNNSTNDLLVYPNPVISTTRIVLPEGSPADVYVDVLDMNGNFIRSYEYEPGIYNLDVDMSRMPAGIYSLRVSGKYIPDHNLKVVKE